MRKFIDWLRTSNRWKHLAGGAVLGLLSPTLYAAALVGISAGAALEFKDWDNGGKWDWIDLGLTILGCVVANLTLTVITS